MCVCVCGFKWFPVFHTFTLNIQKMFFSTYFVMSLILQSTLGCIYSAEMSYTTALISLSRKKYCYKKPKIRHFEPTKVFFKLLDFSIVNQIRLVTAIFKCKSCSTAKGTCLGFEINDCFYTQSCILLHKEKGGVL